MLISKVQPGIWEYKQNNNDYAPHSENGDDDRTEPPLRESPCRRSDDGPDRLSMAEGSTGGACFHRRFKLFSSSMTTIIQTPMWPLLPIKGVQWIHRFRPSSSYLVTQRTFAVTPRPSASAAVKSSRTRAEPPILFMKGDCKIPGTRSEGDANRILREGCGRTSKYCNCQWKKS